MELRRGRNAGNERVIGIPRNAQAAAHIVNAVVDLFGRLVDVCAKDRARNDVANAWSIAFIGSSGLDEHADGDDVTIGIRANNYARTGLGDELGRFALGQYRTWKQYRDGRGERGEKGSESC